VKKKIGTPKKRPGPARKAAVVGSSTWRSQKSRDLKRQHQEEYEALRINPLTGQPMLALFANAKVYAGWKEFNRRAAKLPRVSGGPSLRDILGPVADKSATKPVSFLKKGSNK
jgi:hypothetical protein